MSIHVSISIEGTKKPKMQAPLFTQKEMQRELAITDVIKAYNEEIDWWLENQLSKKSFKIREDPSKDFITARQKRDFAAWYPVSHSPIPHPA